MLKYKEKDYEPDGIIFDVDGTLWDSTDIVARSWNVALEECGFKIKVTAERLKGLFGLPMYDIMKDIIPEATLEEFKHFEQVCNAYEEDFLRQESGILYPSISETIIALSEKYPLFIVSNCQSGYIELVMMHLGIEKYIKDHVCPGDSGLLKADNIRLISKRHGLKAPVYVGDTHMDADACRDADVPIIFAAYGFGQVREPAAVIESPGELLELL